MAVFVFENTTQAEATSFGAGDLLVFSNAAVTARSVTVTPNDTQGGLQNASITLTANGQALTFLASTLSAASQSSAPNTGIVFDDGSSLRLGTADADANVPGTAEDDVIYGFAGADSLTGGAGDDYLYGGSNTVAGVAGADTLNGGDGNDHLYGNALTTTQGTADGADSLSGGNGSDYLQGNAGADTLDGGAGSDRLFGGNGGDLINGGTGSDTANGNVGDDTINGDAGNDILRGGQGNDLISGGDTIAAVPANPGNPGATPPIPATPAQPEVTSNDILYGDLGNDTLDGGTGLDVLFGGAGNDVFAFTAGDSTFTTTANATNANVTDIIADYTDGSDKIDLNPGAASLITAVLYDTTGTTFTTLEGARNAAQALFDNSAAADTTEVVSLQVGTDTLLFYGGAENAIRLQNVTASTINATGTSDFV